MAPKKGGKGKQTGTNKGKGKVPPLKDVPVSSPASSDEADDSVDVAISQRMEALVKKQGGAARC